MPHHYANQQGDHVQFELNVPEYLRPRVARKMGIVLTWDHAIDSLNAKPACFVSRAVVRLCKFYRKHRPKSIGDRCAFEPSCSRYCELCFRLFGPAVSWQLTFRRLNRCNGKNGGLDLPPGVDAGSFVYLEEVCCNIKLKA